MANGTIVIEDSASTVADEALRVLPDEVDIDDAENFCQKRGILPTDLISRMGGSP